MEVDGDRLVRSGLHRHLHRNHARSLAIRHIVAHLLHHQHHLHLLVHLDLGLVLGLHSFAHLLGARVLLIPRSDAAEEDDAGQAAAEDNDRDDDQGDDASSDGVSVVDSLAGFDETITPVASALMGTLAELAVAPVLVGLPPLLAWSGAIA